MLLVKEKMMSKDEVLAELAKRGIRVSIGGCGCCSSPWVTIVIDDEKVFEEDDVRMESIEQK